MKDLIKAYKELETGINRLRKEFIWFWVFMGFFILVMLFALLASVYRILVR